MSDNNRSVLKPFTQAADDFFKGLTRVSDPNFADDSWQQFKYFFHLIGENIDCEVSITRKFHHIRIEFRVPVTRWVDSMASLQSLVSRKASSIETWMRDSRLWPIIPARRMRFDFSENGGVFIQLNVQTWHLTRHPMLLTYNAQQSIEAVRCNMLGMGGGRKEIRCFWTCINAYRNKQNNAIAKLHELTQVKTSG